MKILITGGAGYLGSVLTAMLLSEGFYKITVLDSFEHRVPSLLHLCGHRNLTVVNADARFRIREQIKGFDVIIPLAAVVGAPACDRDGLAAVSANQDAIQTICRHASPDQLIIYPNTNSGYGSTGAAPCTEDTPINPLSLYARTKAEAEKAVLTHPGGIALRFATLFGCSPRMRLDLLVNDFTYRAVRDRALTIFEGDSRRNYLHVRDAAGAILFAIRNSEEMAGKAFNAGLSSANFTKRELCEKIREQLPQFVWNESPVGEDPDKRDYLVSNSRLEALGWRAEHSLEEGIAELIRAFSAMPFESHRNA